jgi:uncharacterized protein (UPF0332 family)
MEALDDVVRYRLQRAREALEDARVLADASRWAACVNRLYYACFYAVSALLLQDGLSSAKHTGVRSLFNRHFVKTDKVPRELAQTYNDLFARRQESDYLDFVHLEAVQVRPWIAEAEQLVEHVASLIEGHRE